MVGYQQVTEQHVLAWRGGMLATFDEHIAALNLAKSAERRARALAA